MDRKELNVDDDELSEIMYNHPTSFHSADYIHHIAEEGLVNDRPFKDSHHILIKAIWNVDRFNPKIDEKLKELRALLTKHNPNIMCDVLHDITGVPIAQAPPLLIACFEGDPDVIRLFIESGADVNLTESEHHLTALHVICDAEYHGQSLRVCLILNL
jgi:hypothetical protein